VCQLLNRHADAVLGLATGRTPLGLYQELIRRHYAQEVSFAEVTTFNLDEYVGLARQHPQSYFTYIHQNLFHHIDVADSRCHVPVGDCANLPAECLHYEDLIDQSGGIDLQLLGIGTEGHIGFNEPGSSLASRTRVTALAAQTRRDNARYFSSVDEVPRMAITMGIATILEAEHIVLLATGNSKSTAVREFIEGPVTSMMPASALQMHPNVTVILDQDAASQLRLREYFDQLEQVHIELLNREQSKVQ
jgi:glucosamine-6-phosphate deaminase